MAVVSLKYKSKQGTLTAPGDVDPGAMIPLTTTTLSTASATITFSDIPQAYEHLQIRALGRGSVAQGEMQIFVRFNSDSGTNYSAHLLRGDGSSVYTAAQTSGNRVDGVIRMPAANATSGIFGVGVIDILDYANTNKYKTLRSLGGLDANGSGQIYYRSGLWMNTNAINSITIGIDDGGNFVQYSSFALYGIKRAGA
jgi:hypothetical protein